MPSRSAKQCCDQLCKMVQGAFWKDSGTLQRSKLFLNCSRQNQNAACIADKTWVKCQILVLHKWGDCSRTPTNYTNATFPRLHLSTWSVMQPMVASVRTQLCRSPSRHDSFSLIILSSFIGLRSSKCHVSATDSQQRLGKAWRGGCRTQAGKAIAQLWQVSMLQSQQGDRLALVKKEKWICVVFEKLSPEIRTSGTQSSLHLESGIKGSDSER